MPWLVPVGILLIGLSLADIFLTVLYARSGMGLLSPRISRGVWGMSLALTRPLGKRRVLLLSFVGPTLLVILAACWLLLLVLGFALLYWPALGASLEAAKGPTSTDFLAALYYSGFSFTTLGLGDIEPKTGLVRMLTVLEAALGFSFFTLTITYFLSVFSALKRRNTFASIIHQKTAGTGNSALLVSYLGSKGEVSGIERHLSDLAAGAADLLESHHFYPVLHYFRFRHPRYAVPRMLTVLLDTATLLRTLPLDRLNEIESAVVQLEGGGRDLLDQIAEDFLQRPPAEGQGIPEETISSWRRHYRRTLEGLYARGAEPGPPGREGEDAYIDRRKSWHPEIAALCADMAFPVGEIVGSLGEKAPAGHGR